MRPDFAVLRTLLRYDANLRYVVPFDFSIDLLACVLMIILDAFVLAGCLLLDLVM